MFTTNPFAALTAYMSPGLLQGYIILMVLAVVLGTLYDLLHDRKARFFFQERQQSKAAATRQLGAGERMLLTLRTLLIDIATFGEFCNRSRRISHCLMFYGFVLYLITTVVMVFAYPTDLAPPAILPALWNLGVLMVLAGGYWFFLLLRVNVVHDGQPPWKLVRADLFIVILLASMTFALLFEFAYLAGYELLAKLFAGFYILSSTLLFISVPWSKFAHMFYKPVMAFQKRLDEATGASDLPTPQEGAERCPPSHT